MGRDEEFKAAQRARDNQEFARMVADKVISATDRFGNKLEVGHLVLWRPPQDLLFEVTEIQPLLDPRMPPGFVKVVLKFHQAIHLKTIEPTINLVVVGMKPKDAGAGGTGDASTDAAAPPAPPAGGDLPAPAIPLAPPTEEPPL